MSFQQINLNDLLALEALLVECHITRAAQRCGISQSAMSHALRRLRATLGDPLLVRGQSGSTWTWSCACRTPWLAPWPPR